MKTKMRRSCPELVMTYGAQTWALTKTETQTLTNSTKVIGEEYNRNKEKRKTRSEDIRKRTVMVDVGYKTKKLKGKYAGHTARQKTVRWGNKVKVWTPFESKRLRGKPLTRWRDEITRQVGHPRCRVAAN